MTLPRGEQVIGKEEDKEALARTIIGDMVRHDPHLQVIGARLIGGGLGWVKLGLKVRQDHLSCLGSCHGGVLFSLADSAFGIAANTYGLSASGIDTHMVFSSAVHIDDELIAEASELSRSRKLATYRVEVYRMPRDLVCTFTGTVYVTNHTLNVQGNEAYVST